MTVLNMPSKSREALGMAQKSDLRNKPSRILYAMSANKTDKLLQHSSKGIVRICCADVRGRSLSIRRVHVQPRPEGVAALTER